MLTRAGFITGGPGTQWQCRPPCSNSRETVLTKTLHLRTFPFFPLLSLSHYLPCCFVFAIECHPLEQGDISWVSADPHRLLGSPSWGSAGLPLLPAAAARDHGPAHGSPQGTAASGPRHARCRDQGGSPAQGPLLSPSPATPPPVLCSGPCWVGRWQWLLRGHLGEASWHLGCQGLGELASEAPSQGGSKRRTNWSQEDTGFGVF